MIKLQDMFITVYCATIALPFLVMAAVYYFGFSHDEYGYKNVMPEWVVSHTNIPMRFVGSFVVSMAVWSILFIYQ